MGNERVVDDEEPDWEARKAARKKRGAAVKAAAASRKLTGGQ